MWWKSPRVYKIEKNSCSSDKEWIGMVKKSTDSKLIKCRMIVVGKDVVFQVDPGASANLLPLRYADSVKPDTRVLKMWNDSRFHTTGMCRTTVRNPCNRKKYSVEFLVYEGTVENEAISWQIQSKAGRLVKENNSSPFIFGVFL